MNRREHLKLMLSVTAGAVLAPFGFGCAQAQAQTPAGGGAPLAAGGAAPAAGAPAAAAGGPFKLPPLGYAPEALEPHIDAQTMKIHHGAHHQAFITNLNGLVAKYPELPTKKPEEILANLSAVPEAVRTPVRNNLGGHWNHTFFWDLMTPGGPKEPTGKLKAAIDATFGGQAGVIEKVTAAGVGRFGSGWAWLAVDKDGKLQVINTPNQDTPHMDGHKGAVVGVDVWEHAYYLKYQNKRAEYLKNWWNTVNWAKASAHFDKLSAGA